MHIADVSHFIRPGTAIDKEAADRSTTVYLTDRRIDMASNGAMASADGAVDLNGTAIAPAPNHLSS